MINEKPKRKSKFGSVRHYEFESALPLETCVANLRRDYPADYRNFYPVFEIALMNENTYEFRVRGDFDQTTRHTDALVTTGTLPRADNGGTLIAFESRITTPSEAKNMRRIAFSMFAFLIILIVLLATLVLRDLTPIILGVALLIALLISSSVLTLFRPTYISQQHHQALINGIKAKLWGN